MTLCKSLAILRTVVVLSVAVAAVGAARDKGAQGAQRIAAIVNEDVISIHDLSSRMDLTVISSNLNDSRELRERLAPRVLGQLIDEKLQLQEASRLGVAVQDAELRAAIDRVERLNKFPPGRLFATLARASIDRKTLLDQIRAGIAWSKAIQREIRPKVRISDEEIEEVLGRIEALAGQQESLVAEILLAVDSPRDEDEMLALARRLIQHLHDGATFGAIARQFSQGGTASIDGNLGWVQKGQLPEKLDAALEKLKVGDLSQPIRDAGGVHILLLRDRRRVRGPGDREIVIDLRQVALPVRADSPPTSLRSQINIARQVRQSVKGCADMERLAKELNSPSPARLEGVRLAELAPELREVIRNLPEGEVSPPIQTDQAILLLMVCKRSEASAIAARREIIRGLEREQINLRARRYLRDLHRAAYIDVRV